MARVIKIEQFANGRIHVTYYGATAGNGRPPVARCRSARSARAAVTRFKRQYGEPAHVIGADRLDPSRDREGAVHR